MVDKAALGAALTTLGGELTASRLEREELRRRREAEAKEERRLRIAERDAEQRRELNRIQLNMAKAEWSTQQIKKAAIGSEWNPEVMGKAWTKHANDGFTYTFNPTKSVQSEDGTYSKIVYDMGTLQKKGAGVDGVGGTPTPQQLGTKGMEKVFENGVDEEGNEISATGQMTRFTSQMVNPNAAFANIESEWTGEKRQQQALEFEKKKAALAEETAQGKRKAEKEGLDIKEKKLDIQAKEAEAKGAGVPKGGSTIKGFRGETVNLSKEKSQTLRTALPIVSKRYSDVNTDNDVWKIDQVRNDKAIRDNMNKQIKRVLDGDLTDAEMVQAARDELGISGEFIQEMINTARTNRESFEEQKPTKKGFFDYVGMAWDKITPW